MIFYTPHSQPRPIRLSEETRQFAWESLHGKYGEEARKHSFLSLDDVGGFEGMSPYRKYDAAIMKIAKEAPIRVCTAERICGAATLGGAIDNAVPVKYQGKTVFEGVSHLTLDFPAVLTRGVSALQADIEKRLRDESLEAAQRTVLESMQSVLTALEVYRQRYLEAAKEKKPQAYQALLRVPFQPPRSFFEAVQSLWLTFSFVRLCGNWPGIGRIDEMLGDYLEQDLKKGVLTLEEAREILASFFIKGCEWIQENPTPGTGDAQHYQNIVLGGVNADGREVTNAVSYLILDVVEELAIGDFPITVRLNENTPEAFKRRIAEVMRYGGGIVAVYNEPLILKALKRLGYEEREARRFANDGCWEVQIPGKTYFSYIPFDALQVLLNDTLGLNAPAPTEFSSVEKLYAAFLDNLRRRVWDLCARLEKEYLRCREDINAFICPVASVFEEGCVQSGKGYASGGAVYSVISPHIGGAPDVGNSLYAIQKLVFEEKKVSFAQLTQILSVNWEGEEALRQYVLNRYSYYGNDEESDEWTVRVLNDFSSMAEEYPAKSDIIFTGGVSTFGRQVDWLPKRLAVPFGKRKGDILSGNDSPTPGTDLQGATAVIRSYCKADLVRMGTGAALDVKLLPQPLQGENGIAALVGLMDGFCRLGGFFMQVDVMDAKVLRLAQEHPEEYKTLSVRVSGWNARFVTLNREWQRMIIERSENQI